jgi:hypothetical protein
VGKSDFGVFWNSWESGSLGQTECLGRGIYPASDAADGKKPHTDVPLLTCLFFGADSGAEPCGEAIGAPSTRRVKESNGSLVIGDMRSL